jgi:hypothetical protein
MKFVSSRVGTQGALKPREQDKRTAGLLFESPPFLGDRGATFTLLPDQIDYPGVNPRRRTCATKWMAEGSESHSRRKRRSVCARSADPSTFSRGRRDRSEEWVVVAHAARKRGRWRHAWAAARVNVQRSVCCYWFPSGLLLLLSFINYYLRSYSLFLGFVLLYTRTTRTPNQTHSLRSRRGGSLHHPPAGRPNSAAGASAPSQR